VRTASGAGTVSDLLGEAQDAYVNGIERQHVSLAQILHALGRSMEGPLFNTMLSVQKTTERAAAPEALSFRNLGAHDPTEVSCTSVFDNLYVPRLTFHSTI
jgi:hypothetical protein